MTYDEFSALALAMPEVTEHVRKYEIDLMRQDRHLARLRAKHDIIAIRTSWDIYDQYKQSRPETFIDFPHYQGTSYLVAKLTTLTPSLAKQVLQAAWETAFEEAPKRS